MYGIFLETGNEEQLKVIEDLQSKLNATNAELISEKQKVVLIFHSYIFDFL